MKQADRQKMCWNCEADVSYDSTYCPFCGTDLLTTGDYESAPTEDSSIQESLASLYKPPYSVRNQEGIGVPDEPEDAAYAQDEPEEEPLHLQAHEEEKGPTGWPLLLLTIGGQLFTLGLLLLFFQKNGKVTLEWNAHLWAIYLLSALPLLIFGYRSLFGKKEKPADPDLFS